MLDVEGYTGSALIVPVPEAEGAVREWRAAYDPAAAAGVPAHVTVLYPFLPPGELDEGVLAVLDSVFAASLPFPFTLARVGRFGQVVYLAPEPAEPFTRLIRAVALRYPQCPPYGGVLALEELVPHLTAAHTTDQSTLDRAAGELGSRLPIEAVAREAWLVIEDAHGHWRALHRFSR